MIKYFYLSNKYDNLEDLNQKISETEMRLKNNPTDWCVVKPMINPKYVAYIDGGQLEKQMVWELGQPLNDSEINKLKNSTDETNIYNIYSIHDGINLTEVPEKEIFNRVDELRIIYGKCLRVYKYHEVEYDEEEVQIEEVPNELMTITDQLINSEGMADYVSS